MPTRSFFDLPTGGVLFVRRRKATRKATKPITKGRAVTKSWSFSLPPQLKQRPKKSLRTMLMLWLLLFSIIPLAFITGYSLVKYEQAIDEELLQRLMANRRELESIFLDYNRYLTANIKEISKNEVLISQLTKNQNELASLFVQLWMEPSSLTHRISLFDRNGKLLSTVYRNEKGAIERSDSEKDSPIYISEKFIKSMEGREQMSVVDIRAGSSVDLSAFSKVLTPQGVLVGHIEEVIRVDHVFLSDLKKRLDLEVTFLKRNIEGTLSSYEHLSQYNNNFFIDKISEGRKITRFDLNIRGEPFGFVVWPMNWGDDQVIVSIGASKKSVQEVLKNVKYAFFSVVGMIILLLIGLSFVISRMLLKPLLDLVQAIQTMDPDRELVQLPVNSDSEMGLLTESFNTMFKRVHQSQRQLKGSIGELEKANAEIRDAQSKLVHTAKMASLGQLVAGVAHEMNNPIGFIHSNMAHLKDYSEKLINIIKASEKTPERIKEIREENEFDYIVKDMPKLIKSCEEGTSRTRNIVLGLRNFSRLEEAKLKEIDIHEGIENTLNLLAGELKNRIEVKKSFGKIPPINCYPSQLNQVFMNILSNSTQAIEGEGTIEIQTKKVKNKLEIVVKDSGMGMSSDTIEKIFDPFFTTKELGVGTGLGLSISYGIIQKHGGDILVKSHIGKGSKITIILPINGPSSRDTLKPS